MSECIGEGCTSPGCSGKYADQIALYAQGQRHIRVTRDEAGGVRVPPHTFGPAVPNRAERREDERRERREAKRRKGGGSRKM